MLTFKLKPLTFLAILAVLLSQTNLNSGAEIKDVINSHEKWRDFAPCKPRVDLCILIDISARNNTDSFEAVKNFVANFVKFVLAHSDTRLCYALVSNKIKIVIPMENDLTVKEIEQQILETTQSADTSSFDSINDAILTATNVLRKSQNKGAPKALAVFYGDFVQLNADPDSRTAHSAGVEKLEFGFNTTTFINTSSGINNSYEISNQKFSFKFGSILCNLPQKLGIGQKLTDTLHKGELRRFEFEVPENELTLNILVIRGSITVQAPNSTNSAEFDVFELDDMSNALAIQFPAQLHKIQILIKGSLKTNWYVINTTISEVPKVLLPTIATSLPLITPLSINNSIQINSVSEETKAVLLDSSSSSSTTTTMQMDIHSRPRPTPAAQQPAKSNANNLTYYWLAKMFHFNILTVCIFYMCIT